LFCKAVYAYQNETPLLIILTSEFSRVWYIISIYKHSEVCLSLAGQLIDHYYQCK